MKTRLTFLHGFLGDKQDWHPLISALGNAYECQTIDPFQEIDKINSRILVGYSMGGRIALQLKQRFPKRFDQLILLSSHPGILSEEEKQARWKEDLQWIHLLETETIQAFLEKWYSQKIFESLKKQSDLFQETIKRRQKQDAQYLAKILRNYSLSKLPQPKIFPETIFFYGEHDLKYARIYHKLPSFIKVVKIRDSGHAIHLENPSGCARKIKGVLNASC